MNGFSGVDPRVLGRGAEEILRMRGEELVHGRAAGDQHRRRGPAAPPRPARLLPQRGDGAGEAREHGHVEVADVDAELERAGGHHAEHVARAQPLLDFAAAKREVAAPIAADDAGVARPVLHQPLDGGQQHLGGQPALGEHDGGDLLPEEAAGELGRLPQIRRADAELRIHHRRVVADEDLVARGRAVFRQLGHRLAGEASGKLAGIGDGGGGHDELRRGAVVAADPLEAPEHVGEVAAEHAAVRVQLVDHDVAEVLEEVHPLGVVGQDPRVEHVRIGEDEVGPGAHRAPRVLRRVPVVREHAEVGQALGELGRARRAGPGRAPWWGRDRARALPAAAPGSAARGGCSRASCPRRWG